MEKGSIAKEKVLAESNGQRWIVGLFIGLNGRIEIYEAASYNGKAPTEYPVILQIVPQGEEPLPSGFKLYLDHAKPKDLNDWKRKKRTRHLGIPALLGKGSYKINDQNYKFIVLERHGKDLWSLFLDHNKKFEAHTVYKITLQIINVLKYIHSKLHVHGDIRAQNIVVDVATQNHIYLMNGHSASVSDDQVDPDKTHNGAAVLLSRDAHMGVSTERGDMEMLFYNLVQWLGIELPWEKNLADHSLVLKEKENAFADVHNWSKKMSLPAPVREYMELLAIMDTNNKPIYTNFISILTKGLRNLCTVRTGILEFSISRGPLVEQVAEDSDQEKQPQRRQKKLTSIPKLNISVDKLAMTIAVNCRHEGEMRLWDSSPDSLIDIISTFTGGKKSRYHSLQNKVANAWNKDIAGLKTKTRKLWEEKASKTNRRTTNEAALTETEHERSSQKTPPVAAASTSTSTSGFNNTNPVISQSHPVAMRSINETLPQENLTSLDLSNISPSEVDHTLQDARAASSSQSDPIQSPVFRTSSSGYSNHSSSRVGSHAEDLPLFRPPDPFHEKEPSQSSKEIAVGAKEEVDINDETVTICWSSKSVDDNQWLSTYEWLNTWLEMKKPALSAFGPIPSEPKAVKSQVQKVRVLRDDFRPQNRRIRQLMSVLAKLPPHSSDAQQLNRIWKNWQDQLDWLEERGRKLGAASLGQVRLALQDVSSNLDKLLDRDPEEQLLRKMETLAGQLEEQGTLLASAGAVTEQLCQAFSDPSFNADLQTELRSVNKLYDGLQHRINVKKTEIERSLNDGRQLYDSRTKIIVWLDKERDMAEKLIVSVDRVKLLEQQQHYQRVMAKEVEVTELLKKSRDFLSKPQNRENETHQSLHDLIKSQWDRLKKNVLQISIRIQTCLEHCDKYYEQRNLFLNWLKKAESEFKRLQPASLDDTETILKELSLLNNEVREKSGELEHITSLAKTFVSACDEEHHNTIKKELLDVKTRWDNLNTDLCERIQSLEDTACRIAIFSKDLKKLDRRVNELMSHNALKDKIDDPNLAIDSIKVLRAETDSLRRPLDDVRRRANDLVNKIGEQQIDASRLASVVELVAAKIDGLKTELLDRLNKAYEEKLANIKDTKPIITPRGEDTKPPILMSNVNRSCEELVDLVSDSEVNIETPEMKPRLLLPLNNPLSEDLIDLVSSSESEHDLFMPQRYRPGPRSKTRKNQFEKSFKNGEQTSKADNLEQKTKGKSLNETNDVHNVSSDKENDSFKNSHKKRKRPLLIMSDSDNSDSDYDDNKNESKNSRKRRK